MLFYPPLPASIVSLACSYYPPPYVFTPQPVYQYIRRQNIACIANEVMVESFVRFLPTHELCTFGGLELLAAHYVVTEELLHEEAGGQGKSFVLEDCMGMNITPN